MTPFLPLHVLLMASLALVGLAPLWLDLYEPDTANAAIALFCGGGVIGLMAYTRYALGVRWGSASMLYLALFWMFHYGLATTTVIAPAELDAFPAWQMAWLHWPSTRAAMLLGLLGATGFVCALGIMTLHGRSEASAAATPDRVHNPAMYWIGWMVMLAGLAATFAQLFALGGLQLLTLSYGQFRTVVMATTTFQAAVNASQLGCLLAICGAGGRRWMAPLAVWTPLGVVMLLIGLRTEAFVPVVGFAIVLAHRGVRFRRGLIVAGALAALVLIPAIKVFRQVGFSNRADAKWTDLSPLSTFVELGGTLRATRAYVDWIADGEDHLWGASYWAPIDRQLIARIIPGREQIPVAKDPRVPARQIAVREGSVGASSTGEAYYNFGALGPLLYYGCIGALFGWLQRRADVSAYGCALLGIAMLLLYFNLRDDWLPVPARAAVALGLLGSCRAIEWLRREHAISRHGEVACS